MIKIPNQKTIVFGEVPHLFDGRLGLLGKISMKKKCSCRTCSLLRRSVAAYQPSEKTKVLKNGVDKDMEQWTPGCLMTFSIPWGLVCLPTITIKISWTYKPDQKVMRCEPSLWSYFNPIKVPFDKLNHTNFCWSITCATPFCFANLEPLRPLFWMIEPKKNSRSNSIKIEGQTWGSQDSSAFLGAFPFCFSTPFFSSPIWPWKNAARFPVWTAFKSASLLVTAPRSSYPGRGDSC